MPKPRFPATFDTEYKDPYAPERLAVPYDPNRYPETAAEVEAALQREASQLSNAWRSPGEPNYERSAQWERDQEMRRALRGGLPDAPEPVEKP